MPTTHPLTLTVLDPTSLLGREVATRVARALPSARHRFFHTGEDPEHLIADLGGEAVLVQPLIDPEELAGTTALVVTAPPASAATASAILAWLRANPTVALVDASQPGIAGDDARCVVDSPPRERPSRPWYHLVDPALAAPVRLVAAFAPLAPDALVLTVLRPVATHGTEGLEELAAQGAARLSGHPLKRAGCLPAVLAFDLAPAPGERSAALAAQLAELFPAMDHTLHVVDAGVFHGHLATMLVHCGAELGLEPVRRLIRGAPGFALARRSEVATVGGVVERGGMLCGDVRVHAGRVSAWLLADGLRVGGADAVVELLASLSAS